MNNTIKEQIEKKCAEMGCANLFPFKENETYKESDVWEYKAVIKALLRAQPGNIFLEWELDMAQDWTAINTVDEDNEDFVRTERAAIWRGWGK